MSDQFSGVQLDQKFRSKQDLHDYMRHKCKYSDARRAKYDRYLYYSIVMAAHATYHQNRLPASHIAGWKEGLGGQRCQTGQLQPQLAGVGAQERLLEHTKWSVAPPIPTGWSDREGEDDGLDLLLGGVPDAKAGLD